MKTPVSAIKIGINEYYELYTQAISEIWEHSKIIAGIPLENWLIAQSVQESRFNENATSPVGAKGIAQFMEATAKEVAHELKHLELFKDGFDRTNPKQSIFAQVYYMNKLFNTWNWKRTDTSRMQLSLASYNAGIGNIITAQKASSNKSSKKCIKNWKNNKPNISKK